MNIDVIKRRVLASRVFDLDAVAFFNATGITDATQREAVNYLVKELKNENLWSKLNVIYPYVGGTAFTHKFNLKDPRDLDVAFRAEMVGNITHNNLGVKGNGINTYIKTKIFINTHINTSNNSFFIYCNENLQEGGGAADFGYRKSIDLSGLFHIARNNFNFQGTRNFNEAANDNPSNNSIGFFGVSRLSSGEYSKFNKGSIVIVNASVISFDSDEIYVLGRNIGGTSFNSNSRRQAFFSFGQGLTNTEMTALNIIVTQYQTILGRSGL